MAASLALDELERVQGINAQLDEVNAAWRTAYALNAPNELTKAERDVRRRMKLMRAATPENREAELMGLARLRKAQRIARRMQRKG